MKAIVISHKGNSLAGVLHPASQSQNKTLFISHGFRGTKDGGGRAVALAEAVAAIGFNVIRYDFTPLQNLSCQIAELNSVINYAQKNIGEQLFLLGRSMGGKCFPGSGRNQTNLKRLNPVVYPMGLARDVPAGTRHSLQSLGSRRNHIP